MPKKTAELYRLPFCPYGMRAKELLETNGSRSTTTSSKAMTRPTGS